MKVFHIAQAQPIPEWFLDAFQEFVSTMASANFTITQANSTTLQVVAGTNSDQVAIGIAKGGVGAWRYITATITGTAPALSAGTHDIFVTAYGNGPYTGQAGPPSILDSTNYAFGLKLVASGTFPSGTGGSSEELYRKVGTFVWDGAAITAITQSIPATASIFGTDVIARNAVVSQVKIGLIGAVAGVALGSAGDVTMIRDTTGGNNAKFNVPVNATAFQVAGTALAASHLSNGVTGTGAVALAVGPTFTGTPAAPSAAVDTSTTQLATTAFVVGQAAAATPLMDGSAAVGTSLRYARADHVHASDTSRAALASPTLTGTPAGPTAAVDTNTTQLATTAFVVAQAASATPLMDGAAAVGTSLRYARGDHVHPVDTSRAPLATPTFTGAATAADMVASDTAAGAPALIVVVSDGVADSKRWHAIGGLTTLSFQVVNDAQSGNQAWLTVTRSGATVTSVNFPNGAVQIGGSQVAVLASPTFTGTVTAPNLFITAAVLNLLSGAAGTNSAFTIGRTATEATYAIAGAAGQFSSSSAQGDLVIRHDTVGRSVFIQTGSAGHAIKVTGTATDFAVNPTVAGAGTLVASNDAVGRVAGASNFGTALPGSGLFNGYRFTLFWTPSDGLGDVATDLIYRADLDATFPWHALPGDVLEYNDAGATPGGAYADNFSVAVTVPRKGIYVIGYGLYYDQTGIAQHHWVAPNSTSITAADGLAASGGSLGSSENGSVNVVTRLQGSVSRERSFTISTAGGESITAYTKSSTAAGTVSQVWLRVRPRKIG